jgi:hypothetical protein
MASRSGFQLKTLHRPSEPPAPAVNPMLWRPRHVAGMSLALEMALYIFRTWPRCKSAACRSPAHPRSLGPPPRPVRFLEGLGGEGRRPLRRHQELPRDEGSGGICLEAQGDRQRLRGAAHRALTAAAALAGRPGMRSECREMPGQRIIGVLRVRDTCQMWSGGMTRQEPSLPCWWLSIPGGSLLCAVNSSAGPDVIRWRFVQIR